MRSKSSKLIRSLWLGCGFIFGLLFISNIAKAAPGNVCNPITTEAFLIPCIQPINPTLRCIEHNPDQTFTAHWGYESLNAQCCPAYHLPIRTPAMPPPWELRANWFTPDPIDRGQPEWFLPGLHEDVFSTTWSGGPLTWSLRYFTTSFPFWEEVSLTADPSNAQQRCNEPPVCDAGGPYVQACTGTETTVQLDGSGSSDPNNDPLAFQWSIVCDDPNVVITGADTATPSVTLFTPGLGQDASCTAVLTVSDDENETSSCQTEISVPACELDCLGQPNGQAQLDLCGVCNGNNACVDCEGIPFGGKVLDRCGVCGGDGQSCLGCEETDITSALFTMDGNSFAQREIVYLATVRLRLIKPGTTAVKKFIEKVRAEATKLYLENWVMSWTLPQISVSCSNSIFCVNSDNSPTINKYKSNAQTLFELAKDVTDRMRRHARGPGDRARARGLLKRAKERLNNALTSSEQVPLTQSQCA